MSTIVAPYPLPPEGSIPDAARWWRFELLPNVDGYSMMMRCDATDPDRPMDEQVTWMSWEFFDGFDTMIDAGLDKPSVYRMRIIDRPHGAIVWDSPRCFTTVDRCDRYLDVVSIEAPSPSPEWLELTPPGDHIHPEDRFVTPRFNYGDPRRPASDFVCTPSRRGIFR